jgi:acyl carrier protein
LIRTPFRTLGYYKQPEATAAVFIKNPFTDDPNDLVYKTGDFGRVLKDGNFEFLGRKDQQVKIRGVRIELSEVASLLRAHTAVEDVAVIDREDGAGNKFLCAYVVLRAAVATTELQAYLSARLPEYMTPSAYVVLDELPRTLNGKIDRRALPAPGRSAAEAGRTLVAPRTPLEQAVAQLWCDALNLDQIGVDENFFTLGAHSLLATQVLSRLRAAFGIELPLRSLFEAPTVAGLAARIETARAQTDGQTSPGAQTQPGAQPPLRRVSRAGALPASFAQQRLWFLDQLNPGDATYNVPVAVRLKGRLCAATLQQSLVEIVNRHEALRTIFAAQAGQPVQVVSDTCSLAWQSCDLSALAEPARAEQATRLAADAARRPFDLATGPLLRVVLMRLDEAEHVALLVVHHIVSDGWSMGLLVKELAALYENFAGGRPSPLAELPIQYADFAHWQREWLQGAALDAQLQAWRRLLGDKLPAWQLPTDRPRGVAGHGRGGVYEQTLDRELCAALQALTNDEGATLFMTLLTAFQVLLHRWTGQTELTVGTDIANRNRVETESLIGFFVNILVMRADASGDPAFRELLARARGQVLESYAHQDLPFSKLVEALRPERTLSRTPLVPVLFVLQNAPLPALELAGLKLDAFEVAQEAARFELALFITETPDGACAKWKYSADLFDQETIARLADRFTALLKSIVARPDARLSDLNMLTEDERRKQAQAHGTLQAHKLSKLMNVRLRGRGDGAQGQSDARQL